MSSRATHADVEQLRGFNRFYTRRMGLLREQLPGSPYPLTHTRVLFELARRQPVAARDIGLALELDPGYLSRILHGLVAEGLVERTRSEGDARRYELALTPAGTALFEDLDRRADEATASLLAALPALARQRLRRGLDDVQRALAPGGAAPALVVRPHGIGDLGWAIERHGRRYAEEYGWDASFEALVATLFARFASQHDPRHERCWIAELDGERVGCVFVVRSEDAPGMAQLRCLLVEPVARGHGVGTRLVEECLAFARAAGYRGMLLWTNDVLVAARRLYQRHGFSLDREYRHHSFGHNLVGQVWSRRFD